MAYDRWDWHEESVEKYGLPHTAAVTHIGMYLAWCHSVGLMGEFIYTEYPEGVEELVSRSLTPGQWLSKYIHDKFTNEDLNHEGNEFAQYYYSTQPIYLKDYARTFGPTGLSRLWRRWSLYSVPDSWQTFDKLKPLLDQRLSDWRASRK